MISDGEIEIVMKQLRKKFKYVLLCPLCNLSPIGQDETTFNSDEEYLLYILENVPKDIAIIVTLHDLSNFHKHSFGETQIKHLQTIYSNLIHIKMSQNLEYVSTSMPFFKYVDGLICTRTLTGLLATLLWDKKIISTCKTYNNWFADKFDLSHLTDFLVQPTRNKNHLLYWYFTHYALSSFQFENGKFLYDYFINKIKKFNQTQQIMFDFFTQNDSIDDILTHTLTYVKKNTNLGKTLSFLEKIFSCRNFNKTYKQITIFSKSFYLKRRGCKC